MSVKTKHTPDCLAVFKNVKALACTALFIALSIVLGKYLAIPGGNILRFSFENLPILLSGIMFGPVIGALTGMVADLLGCVLVGYQINPIVSIGAGAIGLVGGGIAWATRKIKLPVRLLLSVFFAHLAGSVIIKTIGLAAFYSMPLYELMLWRLLNYILVGALEYIVLFAILRNKNVDAQINSIMQR